MHFLHPNDGAMEPVDSAREAGTPAEGNTRLIGHSTLVELHATPETILPESKCSLLRRAYPIDRAQHSGRTARDAGNHLAREQMLSPAEGNTRLAKLQNLPSPHPDDRNVKPISPARGCQPVCQLAHGRASCARHSRLLCAPSHSSKIVMGVWGETP